MNPFIKFFHELFHPHCEHCLALDKQMREDELVKREMLEYNSREDRRDRVSESLERQLAMANETILKLTEKILNPNSIVAPIVTNEVQPKPVHRGQVPFHIIRQTLEQESRAKAIALREAAKPDSEHVEPAVGNNAVEEISKDETFKEMEQAVLNAKTEREAATGAAK